MRWCMFYLWCFIFISSHIHYFVGQCYLWMIFVEGCFSISKLLLEMQSATTVRCWLHSGEYRRSEKAPLIKNSLLPLTFDYGCCLLTSPFYPERAQRFSVMKAPQYYPQRGKEWKPILPHSSRTVSPTEVFVPRVLAYGGPGDQQGLKFLPRKDRYCRPPHLERSTPPLYRHPWHDSNLTSGLLRARQFLKLCLGKCVAEKEISDTSEGFFSYTILTNAFAVLLTRIS